MRRTSQFLLVSAAVLGIALAVASPATARQTDPDQADAAKLKGLLIGLGFEVQTKNEDKGKETFEVMNKTEKYNVPVSYSISSSGRYVWLTCSLGDNAPTKKHEALLKANASIQPVHFYITAKNKLMCGVSIENRGLNPVLLKRSSDLVVAAVSGQDSAWQ